MKLTRPLACFALAAMLSIGCLAQILKKGNGYQFRVKYTVGQVIKLESTTTIDNIGSSAAGGSVKAPMTLKVLSVSKGIASVLVSISAAKSSDSVVSPATSMTVKLDDHNNVPTKGNVPSLLAMPDKPMLPGNRWKAILPMNAGGTIARMDAEYTFAGMKIVDGHPVAVVTYGLSGFAVGTGTMMLLAKDGSMYRNDTHISLRAGGIVERVHTVVKRVM